MRKTIGTPWKLAALVLVLPLGGCIERWNGNGGGNGSGSSGMAAGTYQLAFSADTATASAPVGGLDLTVQLPAGVSVATSADGSGQILGNALAAGAALPNGSLLVGQYAAASRQAHLSLSAAASTAWSGECARLTIVVPAGAAFTRAQLVDSVTASISGYKAVGLAGSAHDTATLTDSVKATVALVP